MWKWIIQTDLTNEHRYLQILKMTHIKVSQMYCQVKPTTVTAPTISQTEKELTRSLLLLAGDVERNPGPENSLLSGTVDR